MATLLDKKKIGEKIVLLTFSRDRKESIFPGNFLSIKHSCGEKLLRRPFSIFKSSENEVSVLVKIVGKATQSISDINVGESADILYPLGMPFTEKLDPARTLYVAGGIGLAGLYSFIDFNHGRNIIFGDREQEFHETIKYINLDCLYVSERESSLFTGKVTDFIDRFSFDTIVACGPKGMLKEIKKHTESKRYLAVCEEIMACGIGLCNGCAVKYDDNTFRRVCVEGPLLDGNRIVYD